MRELGIIPEERNARALADYLLTQNITTRVVANRDGRFGVWVQNEDRLTEARQVFDEFVADPNNTRFQAAARSAREIRKRAEEIETTHRKRTYDLLNRWEGPIYRRAPLTFALIAISVAVFVCEEKLFPPIYGMLIFSRQLVTTSGELVRDLGFANILHGEVWRLVTPIFLHMSIYHILFNMLALAALGQRIEMRKGWVKFAALVLISAVASNIGQYLVGGGNFGGMSGVVFAIAGYLWIKGRIHPDEGLALEPQNAQLMFAWLVLGIIAPILLPGNDGAIFRMANGAHGVGLVSGLLLGLLRFF